MAFLGKVMGIKNSDGNVMNVGYHQNERTATHFTEKSLGSGTVSFRIDKNPAHKDLVWLGHWRWDLKMRNPPIPLTLQAVSGAAGGGGSASCDGAIATSPYIGQKSLRLVHLAKNYQGIITYIQNYDMRHVRDTEPAANRTWTVESAGGKNIVLKSARWGYIATIPMHAKPTFTKNKSQALKFNVVPGTTANMKRAGNVAIVTADGCQYLTSTRGYAKLVDKPLEDGSNYVIE